MISLKTASFLSLFVSVPLLSSSVLADDCGRDCGERKVKISRCADPCPRVSRCAERVERVKCADPCKVACPKCAKGDIENLNACLPRCSNEMTLSYDVEIDYAPAGQFELLVDVINDGARIHQVRVPLNNPNDGDDDEMEFKGSLVETLPIAFEDICNLRVEGNIVPAGGCMDETVASDHGPSLDRKVRSVDIEGDRPNFIVGTFTESYRFVSYPVRAIGGERY